MEVGMGQDQESGMTRNQIFAAPALIGAVMALLFAATASAGNLTTLREAARHTVLNNPEVRATVNEFEASEEQVKVAKGRYLPRIDLEAGIGQERIDDPRFGANDFSRDRVSVLLNQMIYDGFGTRNRVRQFNYASRVRYFEVWNASEAVTADVARAYYDVLRHRELVDLSKENYATHRLIHEQISRRVRAGVSRRVDLDQAYGRLALSESNLLTDLTNLHDVSMRYQRMVGETPAGQLEEPELARNLLPETVDATLMEAYRRSPLLNAAVANVWSANSAADATKAPLLPRLDVRARQDVWNDKDDISGRYEEGVIELVMSYNLYNGGSDRAERRRTLYKADQALNQRDQTCREIRQEVAIAYNDMRALEEQLVFLDRHRQAIGRAREAYRRQFDIGQRTLLDMLDTENEFYDAQRAYITAKRQQEVAYTRTLAGMGALVEALELGTDLHPMELPDQGKAELPDMSSVCPPERAIIPVIDKEAIFQQMIEEQADLVRYMTPQSPPPAPTESAPTQAPQAERPAGW
jgi:outer membrane protein, adhesin transport system